MNEAIYITVVFLILSVVWGYYQLKNKKKKELLIGAVLILAALVYLYSDLFDWEIPAPSELITMTLKPLAHLVYGEF